MRKLRGISIHISTLRNSIKKSINPTLFFFLFLTGCSGDGPVPASAIASRMVSSDTVPLQETSSPINTLFYTPTRTFIPSVTPNPTPIPDLELLDPIFYENNMGFSVFGRIRNNTGEAVTLRGEDNGVEMTVESWDINNWDGFVHITYGPVFIQNDQYPLMNYVLFPGETGVLAATLTCEEDDLETCRKVEESTWDPPNALGYTFQYQSHSSKYTGKTPRDVLHPQAKNINYGIQDVLIFFRFDLQQPSVDYDDIVVFALLVDKNGVIINSASDKMGYFSKDASSISGIIGRVSNTYPLAVTITPILPMTSEMITRLDHLEIFVELRGAD